MDPDVPSRHRARHREDSLLPDLRGVSQLVVDAIVGVTDIVESMHRTILGMAPIVGPARRGRTRGIPGVVYRSVRGLSRGVGDQLDAALARFAPVLANRSPSARREALVAALNGVFGDHLVASNNPLAIPMRLRTEGRPLTLDRHALASDGLNPQSKLLVLVHGLCMSDLGWHRDGHDHGEVLSRELGYTPLYLHYNSGLHISANGRQFADLLEQLLQEWPVPVHELSVIGHSMGGLVARSASHYAEQAGHAWPSQLKALVFLGTPHHGAPLERWGNWVDTLLGISPYTAPLGRMGTARSAGIKDLRHGTILGEAGDVRARSERRRVPLPGSTHCYAGAATKGQQADREAARLLGDGLVSVTSALGQHVSPARSLSIPAAHQRIFSGLGHFDLLSCPEVGRQIHRWLNVDARERP